MPSEYGGSRLDGKVVLVTGAAVRVGRAIALAFAARGAHIALHYNRSRAEAERTLHTIGESGGTASLHEADLSSSDAARALVGDVSRSLGRLDIVVPSAANFERIELHQVTSNAWRRTLDLNLAAPFFIAQGAARELKRSRGSIVFITCSSTATPFRNYLPYVVSKGGLAQCMRALALELAPEVRVNAVAPGTVLPPESMPPSAVANLAGAVPLQRVGTAEDVAEAVLFLATAPFVTGQELFVDGGRSLAAVEAFA